MYEKIEKMYILYNPLILFLITSGARGHSTALNNYDKFYFSHNSFDYDGDRNYHKRRNAF